MFCRDVKYHFTKLHVLMSPAILLKPLSARHDIIDCVFTLGNSGDDALTQRDGPQALANHMSLQYKCPFKMINKINFALVP